MNHEWLAAQLAFAQAPGTIFFIKDHKKTYRTVSLGLMQVCGVSRPNDLIGRKTAEFFEPDYVDYCGRLDEQVLAGRSFYNRIDGFHDAKGAERWTVWSRHSMAGENGERWIVSISRSLPLSKSMVRAYNRVQMVSDAICENLSAPFSLSALAERTDCSIAQLTRDFHSVFGATPKRYRSAERLRVAQNQIRQGTPLCDVALDCGFSDQASFSRFFKKETDNTPAEFRRHWMRGQGDGREDGPAVGAS